MRSTSRNNGDFGLQIVPLLGIPVLLLLFLLVYTAAITRSKPHEGTIDTRMFYDGSHPRYVQLSIDADDSVNIEGVPYDAIGQAGLPVTLIQLKWLRAQDPAMGVMIQPLPSTRQQRVINVLTACTQAGFKDIEFGSLPQVVVPPTGRPPISPPVFTPDVDSR